MASSKKRITAATAKMLYNAGLRSYSESYAMLVDDIFDGIKSVARELGITIYMESLWYQAMAQYIRRHVRWDSIPPDAQADIVNKLKAGE
jgi:hypothetical protein